MKSRKVGSYTVGINRALGKTSLERKDKVFFETVCNVWERN